MSAQKSPSLLFKKLFNPYDKKPASITVEMDKPHSIVEEVFSWLGKTITREQILDRQATKEHISTPKTIGRHGDSPRKNMSYFSPMTLSRNAVQNGNFQGSGWPILQGHLNIQELYIGSQKAMNQFKNLGDIIDMNFLKKHAVTQVEKRYLMFFKGKIYKFKNYDNSDNNCQVLNVKYCNIDLISLQKPN